MDRKFGYDLLLQQVFDTIQGEFEYRRTDATGDSEIEKLFILALGMHCAYGSSDFTELLIAKDEPHLQRLLVLGETPFSSETVRLIVLPQAVIGARRVDFLIHAVDWATTDLAWRKLIVECDGHDFHERTKEQAAKDRAKDRAAVLDGIDHFRFTGSELWRDPLGCAEQITAWAAKAYRG